jgi:hypothetical protein
MSDAEAAKSIREATAEIQNLAMTSLKRIWRARELEFVKLSGRTAYCDCIFYEDGDYVAAYQAAMGK